MASAMPVERRTRTVAVRLTPGEESAWVAAALAAGRRRHGGHAPSGSGGSASLDAAAPPLRAGFASDHARMCVGRDTPSGDPTNRPTCRQECASCLLEVPDDDVENRQPRSSR